MPGPRKATHEHLAAAIRAARGNLAAAAALVGIARATCSQRVQRSPELQALCQELLEESKDRWEEKLEELGMERNNTTAILAKLNAYARDRGYGYRIDNTISGAVDHRHLHALVPDGYGGGSLEQLAKITDAALDCEIAERRARLPDDRLLVDITPARRPDE